MARPFTFYMRAQVIPGLPPVSADPLLFCIWQARRDRKLDSPASHARYARPQLQGAAAKQYWRRWSLDFSVRKRVRTVMCVLFGVALPKVKR